ncbi:MAG: hypothetical protein JWN43_1487 [Gammaproteobacteria bacterium]|nr:hypothetical protein [Gammaproteobacteria bacterium]
MVRHWCVEESHHMQIEIEAPLSEDTLAAVRAGMRRHAEVHVNWEEYADLTFVARAENGSVIGAALGESGRGWLHVSVVWVDEPFRRQQIGTRLLDAIEGEARRCGCRAAYLDTFSYQARPFYERHGYQVFGTLEDYPVGHQRFYMRKSLTVKTRGQGDGHEGMISHSIRPMIAEDYPALVRLWTSTEGVGMGPGDDEAGVLGFLRRNPGMSPVAVSAAGELIGSAMCGHDGRRGAIYHLAVHPAFRGRRVGMRLVEFCLARLADEGIERCNALVFDRNEKGQAFWTHNRWHHRKELWLFQQEVSAIVASVVAGP